MNKLIVSFLAFSLFSLSAFADLPALECRSLGLKDVKVNLRLDRSFGQNQKGEIEVITEEDEKVIGLNRVYIRDVYLSKIEYSGDIKLIVDYFPDRQPQYDRLYTGSLEADQVLDGKEVRMTCTYRRF